MSKPLMIGIAAASALATAAVVMWGTVPDPASTADEGLDARNAFAGHDAREHGSAPVDVAPEGSRRPSPSGERLSPSGDGGQSPRTMNRGQASGVSIFQLTASRQGAAGESASSAGSRPDGMPANFQNPGQKAALGPVFFTGDDEGGGVQEAAVVTPLAQLDPDPGIDWDEQAVAALKMLRDRFAKAIAVDRLDPANPEYAERWSASQPANDEAYRLMFGNAAFEARQLAAARQALALADEEAAPPAN